MAAKDQIKIENLPTRSGFRRRRKVCPFSGDNGLKIDYKDPKMLQRYMSETVSYTHLTLPTKA